MTLVRFIELAARLTDKELEALLKGINQITFEYGWDANLDDNELIKEIYKEGVDN